MILRHHIVGSLFYPGFFFQRRKSIPEFTFQVFDFRFDFHQLFKLLYLQIADFGLANLHSHEALLSTFCGSPLYASPEIVNGLPYKGPEVRDKIKRDRPQRDGFACDSCNKRVLGEWFRNKSFWKIFIANFAAQTTKKRNVQPPGERTGPEPPEPDLCLYNWVLFDTAKCQPNVIHGTRFISQNQSLLFCRRLSTDVCIVFGPYLESPSFGCNNRNIC